MAGPTHRWAPNTSSRADPRIWADECQNTSFPRGSSKFNNSREQSASKGLVRSHTTLLSFDLWWTLSSESTSINAENIEK